MVPFYHEPTSIERKVMRMPLPSDLSEDELLDAVADTADSPVETFVTLAAGESAGYLDMDLRPDHRYLYWTVPGLDSTADGKVGRNEQPPKPALREVR